MKFIARILVTETDRIPIIQRTATEVTVKIVIAFRFI